MSDNPTMQFIGKSSVASMIDNFLSSGNDFDEESLTRRNNKNFTPIRQFAPIIIDLIFNIS